VKLLSNFRSLLSLVFRRSGVENEMEDELRFHIQSRADDLEHSGLSRAQAERQARIEFGGYEKFKEECRETIGVQLFERMVQDVRFGWRVLRKSPGLPPLRSLLWLSASAPILASLASFAVKTVSLLPFAQLPTPSVPHLKREPSQEPSCQKIKVKKLIPMNWETIRER
jgi:hypothetical protein